MILKKLPQDVWDEILERLSSTDRQRLAATSKHAYQFVYTFLASKLAYSSPIRWFYRVLDHNALARMRFMPGEVLVPWLQKLQALTQSNLYRIELTSFINNPALWSQSLLAQPSYQWLGALPLVGADPGIIAELQFMFEQLPPGVQLDLMLPIFNNMQHLEPNLSTVRKVLTKMLTRYTPEDVSVVLEKGQTVPELLEIFKGYYCANVREKLRVAYQRDSLPIVESNKRVVKDAMYWGRWSTLIKQLGSGARLVWSPKVFVKPDQGWAPLLKTIRAWILADLDPNTKIANDFDQTILHFAVREGELALVQLLVQAGADLNCFDNQGRTPLTVSVAWPLCTQYLLENGSSKTDNKGCTILHYYAEAGITYNHVDSNFINTLVKQYKVPLDAQNDSGRTALHIAVLHQNYALAEILLELGADFARLDSFGNTFVHELIRRGELSQAALMFIERCMNKYAHLMRVVDDKGNTLLHTAVENGNVEMARYLLQQGCDRNMKNKHDESPVELAFKDKVLLRRTNRQLSESEYKQLVDKEVARIRMQHYLATPSAPVLFSSEKTSKRACVTLPEQTYVQRFLAYFSEQDFSEAIYPVDNPPCSKDVAIAYAKNCEAALQAEFRTAHKEIVG